jgi:hypothetical protein
VAVVLGFVLLIAVCSSIQFAAFGFAALLSEILFVAVVLGSMLLIAVCSSVQFAAFGCYCFSSRFRSSLIIDLGVQG